MISRRDEQLLYVTRLQDRERPLGKPAALVLHQSQRGLPSSQRLMCHRWSSPFTEALMARGVATEAFYTKQIETDFYIRAA